MKRITAMSASIVAILSSASFAGGMEFVPNDPVVMAPARPAQTWTGPYAGLSYGRKIGHVEGYRDQCVKGTDSGPYLNEIGGYIDHSGTFDCSYDYSTFGPEYHAVVIGQEVTGQFSEASEGFGAFVGYRYDLGHIVGGIEAGHTAGLTTVEGQLGMGLGRVLVYSLAGASDQGNFGGAGVDVRLGERFLVGGKMIEGDFGQLTTIRLGMEF
jgi:opacity protein-like surface antigen